MIRKKQHYAAHYVDNIMFVMVVLVMIIIVVMVVMVIIVGMVIMVIMVLMVITTNRKNMIHGRNRIDRSAI